MANKADGTPQAQRGGRKFGSKAKLKLDEAADPQLLLKSKYGPGSLLPTMTREEREVFQKATSISYERWVEASQERVRGIIDKLLMRLDENIEKVPPSYIALNVSQLMTHAHKTPAQANAGPPQHVHFHGGMTAEQIRAQLFGSAAPKPKAQPAQDCATDTTLTDGQGSGPGEDAKNPAPG